MSENNNITYGGPGFSTLLCLLFIGLKLGGVITWSWLWVLSPLWIVFALFIVVFLLLFFIGLVTSLGDVL